MEPRNLSKEEVEARPYSVWNAYINMLAMEDYGDLTPAQRPAHLVFWYESEVQNGGNFQYFENRSTNYLAATVEALGTLGATCQQRILRDAGKLFSSRQRAKITTVDEFCAIALEGEFSAFDSQFHACSPSLLECLESHLRQNQAIFVIVE